MELVALQTAAALAAAGAGGALPYKSDWLEINAFPNGSLHLYFDTPGSPTVDVEISNVADEGKGEVVSANVAANKVVALAQAAKYVRCVVKTLASGKFGATYSGALQS